MHNNPENSKEQKPTKKDFVEWGKLGGRPKKEIRKTERITLRFTPEEMKILESKVAEKKIKLTEYCRTILNEKEIPKVEENLKLIEYANNFSRLSNFIKMGIFNSEEKQYFLSELETTIKGIKNSIKW